MQRFFLFIFIFLLSFLSHSLYWMHVDFFDKPAWAIQVNLFEQSLSDSRQSLFYGYPATPFLMSGLLLHNTGLSWNAALNTSLAFLISIASASVVLVSFVLRPYSLWYWGVAGITLFHPLYAASTPPSALVAPWLAVLVLWVLYLYEQHNFSTKMLAITGSLIGLSTTIRLDLATTVSTFILLFLLPKIKFRIVMVFICALITFIVFDPYMWFTPLQHIADMYQKITTHFYGINSPLSLLTLLRISLLAIISIFLCLLTGAIPRKFTIWFLLSTVVIFFVLLQSHYQPRWYFYPLLFIWEIFLPLCLLEAFKNRSHLLNMLLIAGLILGYSVL